MITGYNTDVRHQDVVFHVQTEDKGQDNPYIESLVYVGGQVLAARRASYTDLIDGGHGDKAVLARMEKQHRAMIAAIRRGKLDGKLAELLGDGGRSGTGRASTGPLPEVAAARPEPGKGAGVFDEEGDRTLDQVILDYLSSEAEQEQLILMIDGEPDFAVGQSCAVHLRAASSKSGTPVADADVTVRMISTVAEPRTLVSGSTGADGGLHLEFTVPRLGRGTAALIITAVSDFGRAELKQLL
jgi:hypothetical protein